MRRYSFLVRLGLLSLVASPISGFMPHQIPSPAAAFAQRVQATEPSSNPQSSGPQVVPVAPATDSATPPVEPDRPLTPKEQKAADARLKFDRALVDAAVLLTGFEDYRRGKTKAPISLSAFRNLEIELNAIADADPANDQARDMAKQMQMAQFAILQPSVAVADVASRQLYADAMTAKLADQSIKASVGGSGARVVRFVSAQMTRELGQRLGESSKIFDSALQLQFERVVFTNGRRSWTYRVDSGRYR